MEKLDKNESARSLALKFGLLKKLFAGCFFFGGGGGAIALLAPASYCPEL